VVVPDPSPAPPAPEAPKAAAPLTAAEKAQLDALLARDAAARSAPAVRVGKPYVALVNLNVPRRAQRLEDKDAPKGDLVMAGSTVYLTDEEAALFLRADPSVDGRQIPVIRPLHGPGSTSEPALQRVPPRFMSGRMHGPPQGARPDPAGSSAWVQMVPEAAQPQPGSEAMAGQPQAPEANAVDLPPRSAAREAVAGADMDLVNAARAQMLQGQ